MAHRFASGENLLQQSWNAELVEESQEQDIFTGLMGTYSDSDGKVPDGIMQRVTLPAGSNKHTIGMLLDLTGAGRQGAGVLLQGFTETMATREFTVYANDVRHGVDTNQFGLYAHQDSAYGLMEKINPALGKWLKARRGKHIRQAAIEKQSDNLALAPTSLTSGFNKNFLVKNVADSAQPAYSSTLATYMSNIVTALQAAGTGAASLLDVSFFTSLEYYITVVWKIVPMDNGTYIVTVPARSARYLKLLDSSESISGLQRTTLSESIAKKAWQQVLGQIGRLILVVDDRAPIMVINNLSGSPTVYYRDVGTTDGRTAYTNTATQQVFDIGMVFGKGGITETMAMKPRYDDDLTDVGRLRTVGVSTTYGYQVTEFDDPNTPTATSRRGQNCAIFASYSGSATV